MERKNVVKITIFITIAILLFIFFLIFFRNSEEDNEENKLSDNDINTVSNTSANNNTTGSEENNTITSIADMEEEDSWDYVEENVDEKKLKRIDDLYSYFLMKQCLEKYYNMDNSLNCIDKEAIDFLGLNTNNISALQRGFYEPLFCIDKIFKQSIDASKDLYVVYHKLQKNTQRDEMATDTVVFVKIDEKNVDFSIYPYEYLRDNDFLELEEDDEVKLANLEEIPENADNKYKSSLISKDEQTCLEELYERYVFELLFDVETLYGRIHGDYKDIRFPNYEDFLQYVNDDYKYKILENGISRYRVNKYELFNQYIAILDDDSHLIFNVLTIMDYNIMLDDYTVTTQEYNEVYSLNLPTIRGKYCINRIMSAINEKNYEFIYYSLNPVLKNNYYPDIQKLKEFLDNNFFETSEFQIDDDIKQVATNVYQYKVKVTDETEESPVYRNFIMTVYLDYDTEFKISIMLDL